MSPDLNGKSEIPDPLRTWAKEVADRYRNLCANCGQGERLAPKLVVPLASGGKLVPENGVLLCRACDMASSATPNRNTGAQRLVNFWVSASLFERVKAGLEEPGGFRSMGALVRFLVDHYVAAPARFDDLSLFQDEPGCDSKINVWIGKDIYAQFKALLDQNGWTVTDGIKSLLVMWHIDMFRNGLQLQPPSQEE